MITQEYLEAPAVPMTSARLADLAEALLYEASVIEELRQTLLRQRAGVAADDGEMVETSVHAMGRALLTLEEAKRRRAALTALLSGADAPSLDRLDRAFGGTLPGAIEEARVLLRRTALRTAQDLAINQHILKRALEAGDSYLQKLFAMGGEPTPGYQAGEAPGEPAPRSGVLLNRTA